MFYSNIWLWEMLRVSRRLATVSLAMYDLFQSWSEVADTLRLLSSAFGQVLTLTDIVIFERAVWHQTSSRVIPVLQVEVFSLSDILFVKHAKKARKLIITRLVIVVEDLRMQLWLVSAHFLINRWWNSLRTNQIVFGL